MTIEIGSPGVSGYGYTVAGNAGQTGEPPGAETDQASPAAPAADAHPTNGSTGGANSGAAADVQSDKQVQAAEEVAKHMGYEELPGYEASASRCFHRAGEIARSLNHMSLSADHLMLALTMDSSARRLLERLGDISQLRETAMQRLGRYGSARNAEEQSNTPTSDLADIAKIARDAANERDQSVAISDVIAAFPTENGRLTYAAVTDSQAVALIQKMEQGLVPRVTEAMTAIEAAVRDAMQRQHQTVQRLLDDLNSREARDEQRQREFMDEIRRQVRDAADMQLSSALKDFTGKLDEKIAEIKAPEPLTSHVAEIEAPLTQDLTSETEKAGTKPKGNWSWLALL
jgi:Clp amino terminal domain, pathogenicity island component